MKTGHNSSIRLDKLTAAKTRQLHMFKKAVPYCKEFFVDYLLYYLSTKVNPKLIHVF